MKSKLPREELELLYKELIRRGVVKARNNLNDFVKFTKRDYSSQWYHKKICNYLDKLYNGDINKLMIFLPPQHGKSELSSRRLPCYVLGKSPDTKVALVSYSRSLSSSFNRDCQNIINTNEYKLLFPQTRLLTVGEQNNNERKNTNIFEVVGADGSFRSVSIGSALAGNTVDLGIIDDPFKDRLEANSELVRDRVWQWYQDIFLTRLHNNSKQLMLFTRWHEDDLAGRLTDPNNIHYNKDEANEWVIIAIPALKEATPPHKKDIDIKHPRGIDEALWEAKHSAEKYKRRREVNPTSFNSLDQQRPTAQEGNKIKKEWFITENQRELSFNIATVACDFFIDGAFTESTKNDETGLLSCYFNKANNTLYIINCIGVRRELYELLKYFKEYVKQNNYKAKSSVFIELKASGQPLKSMLSKIEHGGFNTRGIDSKVVRLGKYNRVENAEPFLASGKVVLLKGGWNEKFINQCISFPNGVNDDMVDCLTYAIHHYFIKQTSGGVSYA